MLPTQPLPACGHFCISRPAAVRHILEQGAIAGARQLLIPVAALHIAWRNSRTRARARQQAAPVPCVNLDNLSWFQQGQDSTPPVETTNAVKEALATHGIFTVRGHGISQEVLQTAREESAGFFNQPLAAKQCCAVFGMERNRGFEIYPHHQRFLDQWTEIADIPMDAHPEPSARQGIVCERFCCGPPEVCEPAAPMKAWKLDDFYHSEYGKVFFAPNVWPAAPDAFKASGALDASDASCRDLQPSLLAAFGALEALAEALLLLLAEAADMEPEPLRKLLVDDGRIRHSSMLQVCNYPSLLPRQLRPTESEYQLRAKAHQDFGAFTILSRCPGTDSGKLKCGRSGALEVRLPSGDWMCVPAKLEELTVMPGTLMEYLTAGRCPGVTHRVTNPPSGKASASRRLSLTYVVKPDYTAPAVPPGSKLASDPSAPALGDLWRVGWQEKQRLTGAMPHGEAVQYFHRHRQELRKRLLLQG
ncbi:unnamed protein product [Effrenium voratum]|nr:unnamed protein product [Effrenium voratum]